MFLSTSSGTSMVLLKTGFSGLFCKQIFSTILCGEMDYRLGDLIGIGECDLIVDFDKGWDGEVVLCSGQQGLTGETRGQSTEQIQLCLLIFQLLVCQNIDKEQQKEHAYYSLQKGIHLLMGKKKQFNKHRSIVFKLVSAVDKNNQERIMFQTVVPRKCTLSEKQKEEIIKQFSNQHEFQIEKVPQHDPRFDGVPPEILEKIRGRTDLVINGKLGKGPQVVMEEDDFLVEEVSDQEMMEGIEQEEFDEEEGQEGQEEEEEWQTDEEGDEDQQFQDQEEGQQVREVKPQLENFEEDFPSLPEPGTSPAIKQQQQHEKQLSKLTKTQLQILNDVLPKNYEGIKILNAQTKMFDVNGNPIDGYDYSQHYSRGGEAIAKFEVEFIAPTLPDVDIEQSKMPVAGREVDEALQKAEIYEELEDDFFITLMLMSNVKVEKKQVKKVKRGEREVEKEKVEVEKTKPKKKNEEIAEHNQQEFTEQELFEVMNQMRNTKKHETKKKNEDDNDADYEDIEQDDIEEGIEESQNKPEEEQQEDQRQFHELNKKERRIFMKNYKIPEVEDLAKQELKIKMKTFKGVKPEQIHLKTIHPRIPFSQDIAMQNTLNKGSDTSDPPSMSEASDDDDDIVSYHTKHSTVSSSVNYIMEEGKKKEKKEKKQDEKKEQSRPQISRPEHPILQKRDRNETKEEKKLRKQAMKDFKKDKRESKKAFAEELKVQKRIVDNNTKAALHGIAHISVL